jgi:hypothetical protein
MFVEGQGNKEWLGRLGIKKAGPPLGGPAF